MTQLLLSVQRPTVPAEQAREVLVCWDSYSSPWKLINCRLACTAKINLATIWIENKFLLCFISLLMSLDWVFTYLSVQSDYTVAVPLVHFERHNLYLKDSRIKNQPLCSVISEPSTLFESIVKSKAKSQSECLCTCVWVLVLATY